jgi:hypothetical protein
MRKILIGAIVLAAVATMLIVGQRTTKAGDHPPEVTAGLGQDFTDFYAWMDANGTHLNMIGNIAGEFSTATQYAFHVHSGAGYGQTDVVPTRVICQFAALDNVECWAGDPANGGVYIQGDATAEAGLSDADGKLKVFAGPRNDPFFFNLTGFVDAVVAVNEAAPGLTLDADGCVANLDTATAATLQGLITTGQDDFATQTVSALVVQVDKTLVNGNGDTLSVWSSTHVRE